MSFLKTELEGVEISLIMNYEGGHYATHRSSSTWDVSGIKIERTIDGVEYVYEQDGDGWWRDSFYPISDYLTVDGVTFGELFDDEPADEKVQSACDRVIKPIYDAATLALAPMFKEWFDKKINYLAESAEKQYDYLTSDEGVGESMMANEKEFDKDGNDA